MIEAIAVSNAQATTSISDMFEPPYECEEISLQMEYPFGSTRLYTDDNVMPVGSIVPRASIARTRARPRATELPY